ncbi:MFS transporter [Rhodococcus sp. IEGM 248]|uniref:MFS transporter n=1 Tax=Rhodococcus opacus TaxID=37919 RepID=UPI0013C25587|nr:MFS transporter [Rhodococcus opacus]MDV7084998.1 MFS transporter [Rhodococcus opacus]NDV04597.1 MFS transporter [Rhodococcus sp. IEGM 248]
MTASIDTPSAVGTARRWWMLALGMFAQAAQAVFVNGVAFLIPELQENHGLSLARTGLLVAAPTLGVMLTLIAWGALADRYGERRVLAAGMAATAAAGIGAALSGSLTATAAFLLLGGMAAASANAASGRVVVGWFPPERRGLAMGIRQMSLPLGIACAALTLPSVAHDHGIGWALALPAALCATAALACALWVVDPPRPSRSAAEDLGMLANPYRDSGTLWRIHAVSVLLVVPQYTVWTYALVWLISERHWEATAAGLIVTVAQILGAFGRMGVGFWSDVVGSRMRPLRWVAVAGGVSMAALAVTDALDSPLAIAALLAASVATVAPNGLAFTAVAEIAGPFWGGRALGVQNTGQFVAASIVPPVFGALIGIVGFPVTFAIAAGFPAASIPLIPVARSEDGATGIEGEKIESRS